MNGSVRIISGRWRGRKLGVPAVRDLRPSGDRVRETLFNWLQTGLHGRHCLDLFAGTGALGLEAASRGAGRVVLVERERLLVKALERIAGEWPGAEAVQTIQADALNWLPTAQGPYDLVFADPPFAAGYAQRLLELLQRPGLLSDGARVYFESPARDTPPVLRTEESKSASGTSEPNTGPESGEWCVLREKILGEVRMQLLARRAGQQTT